MTLSLSVDTESLADTGKVLMRAAARSEAGKQGCRHGPAL